MGAAITLHNSSSYFIKISPLDVPASGFARAIFHDANLR